MTVKLPKPMVTVVIPCYNYGSIVGRAIESVKSQEMSNFECIIVDDGSTDNTEDAVLSAIDGDPRFRYIRQDNQGVAIARNTGVFSGSGKYVCCLDADDQIAPEFLQACVMALEEDQSISIAYTGLWYILPSGKEGLSSWPDDFNYDESLKGKNQVPTCNVAKRIVWERLGGQRQRYAPGGAGEEDAEMWLRAGAYGFRAKKVTQAGLFLYSWMSGRVSGDKSHKMVDYRAWHPWVEDKKYPILSLATPAKISHPVRQYDFPVISVIIPVGKGHERLVETVLDSLEAQTFRKWEVIVVWDSPESPDNILRTFPYINLIQLDNPPHGAGYARNRGVEHALSSLILFIDADDWFSPDALTKLITAWELGGDHIIYSDYVGKAVIDEKLAGVLDANNRLMEYDKKSGLATISYQSLDYVYEKAVNQPDEELYIWCLVTALIPKKWHFEIGGFDEEMKSWEDWDYYIRMAKAGKCFMRVPEQLVAYRFYSGNRREDGLHDHKSLLQYLTEKYERIPTMGCGCSNNKRAPNAPSIVDSRQNYQPAQFRDDDFAVITYNHPNQGQHKVVGPYTGKFYGYRSGGDSFLVHRADINANPSIFQEKSPESYGIKNQPEDDTQQAAPPPPPPPDDNGFVSNAGTKLKLTEFLEGVPGMREVVIDRMIEAGIESPEDFPKLGFDKLSQIRGVGTARAKRILSRVNQLEKA